MDHLTEQDAGLLEQGASMLEEHAEEQRTRGNCSAAEGAACSAHAIRRLAPAMLRAGHGCLAQIEEPSQPARIVLDDNWKARMLDGRAPERDDMGLGDHPELPWLDEGMMPRSFFAALGLELAHTSAEDQLDGDVLGAMSEAVNWSRWMPTAPQGGGWKLVSIFDTEDGPVAWWLRELPEAEDGTTTIRNLQAEVEKLEARIARISRAGAAPAAVAPFGYVNTHTGQFFKDVEPCRQGNEGHWRTVYLQPAAVAGPASVAKFTDESTADPVEKSRRYLKAMADETPNSVYFFGDGYPRRASSLDAKATLAVLEQLAAQAATALEAPAAPAVPPGFALVPLRLTRAMDEAISEEGWQWEDLLAAAQAVTEEQYEASAQDRLSRDEVRAIFLECGFVIKEGQNDLKPYVYEAAQVLESRVRSIAATAPQAPAAPAVDASDTALLDALASESMDLRCFDMPTGQGDADVGWRVVQHHMGKPAERVVSEVYKDDPRSAIRAAIARLERDPYCTGPLHEEDAGLAAQAKEGGESA